MPKSWWVWKQSIQLKPTNPINSHAVWPYNNNFGLLIAFIEVFPKYFHWICWIYGPKIFVITVKGFEPTISCVRNKDASTVPARHGWKTGSLNWLQCMLQWFIRFPEFTEFPSYLGKTLHVLAEKNLHSFLFWPQFLIIHSTTYLP